MRLETQFVPPNTTNFKTICYGIIEVSFKKEKKKANALKKEEKLLQTHTGISVKCLDYTCINKIKINQIPDI